MLINKPEPEVAEAEAEVARTSMLRRLGLTGAGATIMGAAASMGAFAQELNLTSVVGIMNQMPDIISPIGAIVVAIAPVIIIVSVVGFATGLFDQILSGIGGAFKFGK